MLGELLLTSYSPSHALRTVVFKSLLSGTVIEMTNNYRLKDALYLKIGDFLIRQAEKASENLLVMFAYCGAWPCGFAGRA